MTQAHNRRLKKIVEAKANALLELHQDLVPILKEALETYAREEARINAMPYRGFRQKQKRDWAHQDLEGYLTRELSRVGTLVNHTLNFVRTHQEMLSEPVRKKLFG
jgi:hypothetical protein